MRKLFAWYKIILFLAKGQKKKKFNILNELIDFQFVKLKKIIKQNQQLKNLFENRNAKKVLLL